MDTFTPAGSFSKLNKEFLKIHPFRLFRLSVYQDFPGLARQEDS